LYAAEKKHIAPIQILRLGEILIRPPIKRISLNRFEVNGPAKFNTIRVNHRPDRAGIVFIVPLLEIRLRV